ncbi:hypothetical protein SUNI508_05470 [Seiridium unicorne]|uniref:Uncharacterized protein n=1 Tax=Seiridium unicorne TaxID=138068 RepID=A0ABR2V4Y7_9PEZI
MSGVTQQKSQPGKSTTDDSGERNAPRQNSFSGRYLFVNLRSLFSSSASLTAEDSEKAAQSTVSSRSRRDDDNNTDENTKGQEWDVVGQEEAQGSATSGKYDITIGWGRWKHTLYSHEWTCTSEAVDSSDHKPENAASEQRGETESPQMAGTMAPQRGGTVVPRKR